MSVDAFPARAALGSSSILGRGVNPGNQLNITSTPSDISNLTVPVYVRSSNRILRVTGFVPAFSKQSATTRAALILQEDGVQVQKTQTDMTGTFNQCILEYIAINPTPGPHTYKLRAESDGNVAIDAGNSGPSFLLIEDITGSPIGSPGMGITDYFYTGGFTGAGPTSNTDILTQNSIAALPYNYTMIVNWVGQHGFNGADNILILRVLDELGNSINWRPNNSEQAIHQKSPQYGNFAVLGKKDYAAGATCGFRCNYRVDTSNVWGDWGVHVRLVPR